MGETSYFPSVTLEASMLGTYLPKYFQRHCVWLLLRINDRMGALMRHLVLYPRLDTR